MELSKKLLDYFLYPKESGYDMPKTLLYALLLIVAIYGVYIVLKKLKVKIDYRLAIGIFPYILLGSTLRVLQDLKLINSYLFVTPGIYVFVFSIVIVVLLISLFIERKKSVPYFKTMFLVGLVLFSSSLSFIHPTNIIGFLFVLLFFSPWVVIFYKIKWGLTNKIVTLTQMFDATVTYVSISFFGFLEQHVVPTFFISLFSPFSFIVLKIIGVIAVLIFIDKFSEDKEFNNYLKLIIWILGAATGGRDFLALLTLV